MPVATDNPLQTRSLTSNVARVARFFRFSLYARTRMRRPASAGRHRPPSRNGEQLTVGRIEPGFRDFGISTFRDIDISTSRDFESSTSRNLESYPMFLVPLHCGYPLQLQNSRPELMPFLATRRIMGLPQSGHVGASASTLFCVRWAKRSAVSPSVNPPSTLNSSRRCSSCRRNIITNRLQSTRRQLAATRESLPLTQLSNLCFCARMCMLLWCNTSSLYSGLSSCMLFTVLYS